MTKKDLLKSIYLFTYPDNIGIGMSDKIILNINRGKYKIKEAWNIYDGLLVSIDDGKKLKSKYVDNLTVQDQIFIYRKLLKVDIYRNLKKSSPDRELKDIYDLTMVIFNNLTKQKKVIHRN